MASSTGSCTTPIASRCGGIRCVRIGANRMQSDILHKKRKRSYDAFGHRDHSAVGALAMTAEAAKSRFAVDRKKMVVALLLGFGLETILMFAGDNFLPHRLMNWTQLPGIDLAAYPARFLWRPVEEMFQGLHLNLGLFGLEPVIWIAGTFLIQAVIFSSLIYLVWMFFARKPDRPNLRSR